MVRTWNWSGSDWQAILAAFDRQGGDAHELLRAWNLPPPHPTHSVTLTDHQEAWLRAVEAGHEEPTPIPVGPRLLSFRTAILVG